MTKHYIHGLFGGIQVSEEEAAEFAEMGAKVSVVEDEDTPSVLDLEESIKIYEEKPAKKNPKK